MNTDFVESVSKGLDNFETKIIMNLTDEQKLYVSYLLDIELNHVFQKNNIGLIEMSKYNILFK